MSLVDFNAQTGAPAGPATAQEQDLTVIQCGQPFYLEIEAIDACNNRYQANDYLCYSDVGSQRLLHACQSIFRRVRSVRDLAEYM